MNVQNYRPSADKPDRHYFAGQQPRPFPSSPQAPALHRRRHDTASWQYVVMKYAGLRGLPSAQHRGYQALLNSPHPDQSSAQHSPICLVHYSAIRRGYHRHSNLAGLPLAPLECRCGWHVHGWPVQPVWQTHQPYDNATHAKWRRLVMAPRRYLRPLAGGRFSVRSSPPSYLAWPTCLCQSVRGH